MAALDLFWLILGMAAVTQLPRVLPFAVLGEKPLPESARIWLSYVPASIISAMLAMQLLVVNNEVSLTANPAYLAAAAPSLFVGLTTRNILLTVLTGIISVALFRLWV